MKLLRGRLPDAPLTNLRPESRPARATARRLAMRAPLEDKGNDTDHRIRVCQ
jgi:hypothetical protein